MHIHNPCDKGKCEPTIERTLSLITISLPFRRLRVFIVIIVIELLMFSLQKYENDKRTNKNQRLQATG